LGKLYIVTLQASTDIWTLKPLFMDLRKGRTNQIHSPDKGFSEQNLLTGVVCTVYFLRMDTMLAHIFTERI